MPLSDFNELTDDLVRDDAGLIDASDRAAALRAAIARYSRDRPQTQVEDSTSAGGHDLVLPTAWEARFSAVKSLEYPIGEVPPVFIENEAWRLYQAPAAAQVIQLDAALQAGDKVRASFTIAHVLNANEDSVPALDREAVAQWAAALLLDQLANRYAGDTASSIGVDSVDHASKSRDYAARARAARKRYFDELGLDPKRNTAAGVVVDLDLSGSLGQDRLTHSRRFR